MKKVARLVEFSLMTRVIVDENATEDQIIKASYKGIQDKIDNRELGDNLVENDLDEECPFGTFDTDDPMVTLVLLSTVDQKYVVTGKGIPTQIISFDNYSDWDSIQGVDGYAVLDCQIDFDDSVKEEDTDKYYQFQTVNLIENEDGSVSMGYDYRGNGETDLELIVSHKPLAEAIVEHSAKLNLK
jgi:hypothetical protein